MVLSLSNNSSKLKKGPGSVRQIVNLKSRVLLERAQHGPYDPVARELPNHFVCEFGRFCVCLFVYFSVYLFVCVFVCLFEFLSLVG